jgi:hypothetical protein
LSIFCSRGTPPRALLTPPLDTTHSSHKCRCRLSLSEEVTWRRTRRHPRENSAYGCEPSPTRLRPVFDPGRMRFQARVLFARKMEGITFAADWAPPAGNLRMRVRTVSDPSLTRVGCDFRLGSYLHEKGRDSPLQRTERLPRESSAWGFEPSPTRVGCDFRLGSCLHEKWRESPLQRAGRRPREISACECEPSPTRLRPVSDPSPTRLRPGSDAISG